MGYADVTWTDLRERHRQPEIMDAPDLPPARFVETLKGLGRVNTVTRSARLMWPDLEAAARRHPDRPMHVLDVACGGGDVLLALWRTAKRARLKVEMAGCDLSTTAVTYAAEHAAKAGVPIKFFVHRVPQDPLPNGYDVIMSTLFLHHLDEDGAISFLREAAEKTRDRIVIQDLVRSPMSYWFARVGTGVLFLNDICRLDGQTSVEGAFTRREALELARKAGLDRAKIVPRFPFRYLIRWVRP
jgi:2-polyprenyl-3-methyl-5-hydroxy-6-metoxy-1,4-benzoquinol methylase